MSDRRDWHRLFVYGTLRRNGSAAHILAAAGASFVAVGRTPGRLVDLGAYPGMLPAAGGGSWVRGELYELTDAELALSRLDAYEGPGFERATCGVVLDDGTGAEAWTYLFRGDARQAPPIPDGSWPG